MSTRVVNRGESTATTASITLSGALFELPAGPLGFAGVLEWASQEYDLNADPSILPTYPTDAPDKPLNLTGTRSEEHPSELQSLMRISYAVFCLKKKTTNNKKN